MVSARLSSSRAVNVSPLVPLALWSVKWMICVCVAQNMQSRYAGPRGLPNFCVCYTQTLKLARFKCICHKFGVI
jgi:hypothetical protein